MEGLAVMALGALGVRGYGTLSTRWDGRRVRSWLSENTRDEPGESHRTTLQIATVFGWPEERARRACLAEPAILGSDRNPDLWSVWREEPRSIYEKRGLRILGSR